MGLFSGIKKAFKKIVKGVKKVVKGVVKGVKKVAKKIGSSKILKALAIAAAVVVTGGAAIGAFGGSLASSSFGSWMVGASKAMTGFTIGGTTAAGTTAAFGTTAATTATGLGSLTAGVTGGLKVGSLLKPFAAAGKFVGATAGKITDLTGLTTEAARTANMSEAAYAARAAEHARWAELPPGQWTSQMPHTQPPVAAETVAEAAAGSDYLTGNKWGDFALKTVAGTASQTLSGYGQAKLMEGDPTGRETPLATESKEYKDALQVYASNEGINYGDIYRQLSFGTADPSYQVNSELYSQQAFQPVA